MTRRVREMGRPEFHDAPGAIFRKVRIRSIYVIHVRVTHVSGRQHPARHVVVETSDGVTPRIRRPARWCRPVGWKATVPTSSACCSLQPGIHRVPCVTPWFRWASMERRSRRATLEERHGHEHVTRDSMTGVATKATPHRLAFLRYPTGAAMPVRLHSRLACCLHLFNPGPTVCQLPAVGSSNEPICHAQSSSQGLHRHQKPRQIHLLRHLRQMVAGGILVTETRDNARRFLVHVTQFHFHQRRRG